MNAPSAISRRFVWIVLILALLGGLAWYSAFLAANRIYQVDECQNIYMAKVFAAGQSSEFFTTGSLFLLGPLSWLTQTFRESENVFALARVLFLGIFWFNLFLVGLIAGKRIRSTEGLIALAGAATLAPLWDYGFEVRHDNLVVTGILLIWWLVRTRPMGLPSYLSAGAITVALSFIAVKSVVYVLPLAVAVLVFPPPGHERSRLQLALAWVGGALLALLAIRLCYGTGGKWDIYFSAFRGVAKYSAGAQGSVRFAPWFTLNRLPAQVPLLLAVTFAAGIAVILELWKRRRAAITWDGNLPEFLLVLGVMAGLFLNPTPFPYNLVHVVPYFFLLAFGYAKRVWNELQLKASALPLVVSVVVFAHLVPFGVSVRRHLEFRNYRQTTLMHFAEELTDPEKDPVYDGIGMVVTRPSINFHWYLHSLNIRDFINGSVPSVREMLAARPAAVLIPNYRMDWLTKEDHDFIQSRYVPLTDDLWVLGKELPAGGGDIEIVHSGRYTIAPAQASNASESVGTLDGVPFTCQPITLNTGIHRIETTPDRRLRVLWAGPRLAQINPLGNRDHHLLFVNWY